jgi:hypothetical protein
LDFETDPSPAAIQVHCNLFADSNTYAGTTNAGKHRFRATTSQLTNPERKSPMITNPNGRRSRKPVRWIADPTEEWRTVQSHCKQYEVSNRGNVRRIGSRFLKGVFLNGGIANVALKKKPSDRDQTGVSSIKSLVMRAFKTGEHIGPDVVIVNVNGDPMDNRPENLTTVPYEDFNRQRMIKMAVEERRKHQKLNPEKVRMIRELRRRGLSYVRLANEFRVSTWTIEDVLKRRRWGHVI